MRSISEIYGHRSKPTDSYGEFFPRYDALSNIRPEHSVDNRIAHYDVRLPQRPVSEVEGGVNDVLSWMNRNEQRDVPEYLIPKMEILHDQLEKHLPRKQSDVENEDLEIGGRGI